MEPATTDLTVSLIEQTNFAVSDRAGDIMPGTYHGFFVADTRFLSRLVLRLDGRRLEPLASGGNHHATGTFYLASPSLDGAPAGSIAIFRDRTISTSLGERIRIISYGRDPVTVELTLEVEADFADIFEVRGRRRRQREITTSDGARSVRFEYAHDGYRRSTTVGFDRRIERRDGRLAVSARLEHGRPWDLGVRIEPRIVRPRGVRQQGPTTAIDPAAVRAWRDGLPALRTTDGRLMRAWNRAVRDMASLLLVGPAGSFFPAAGVPWYLAVFGRDAAITAMQSLLLGPDIASGALRQLGAYQGAVVDAWRDEEPGKLPHEVRTGELSTLGTIPGRYYGSVDATPLYVMLFVEVCRRTGWLGARAMRRRMPELISTILPHAEDALAWIERSVDADGLLWYDPPRGSPIRNQAWKDSYDSMRFADGSWAEPPIAAVEVQGYVVAARRGMAEILERLGRPDEAHDQQAAATRLAGLIDDRFWMPAERTYALGIDGAGSQIDGIASNAGHLLWADAVPRERATAVGERLLAADMASGWGVRTLSSRNPGYNPIGYHTGSVWPHDTSLVIAGLARHGQRDAALRLIDELLDASDADPDSRLPELFAGFDRDSTPDLVPYPTACSPQAWATGAIFLAVETLLQMPASQRPAKWRSLELVGAKRSGWASIAPAPRRRRGG